MIFKKIGLAITFSPNALSLLRTAKRLRDLFDSQLCLIHVGEQNNDTEKLMNELLTKAGIDENSYEIVWQKGDPSKIIINLCSQKNVDLLIAGALEKESMLKYYIGSVARNIMREGSCSILILTHPAEEPKSFKKICASVQYNPLGEYSIKKGFEFAKLEKAEEFILIREFQIPGLAITISDSGSVQETEQKRIDWQNEEEQKLKMFAAELNITGEEVKTICLYGKQGWEFSNYARESGGDLMIVPSPPKRLKLFDRIFQHDIEFILKQLPCALLIVRQSERN
jgi:nucleotide-binding universal stress UspA family protein